MIGGNMVLGNPFALNIFAPNQENYGGNWVEQILGEVIRPIFLNYENNINWIWITRYRNIYDENSPPLGRPVPLDYIGNNMFRYIILRLSLDEASQEEIHNSLIDLLEDSHCICIPNEWSPYDVVNYLGSNRFIRQDSNQNDREQRALLIAQFIDSVIRLKLNSLTRTQDGIWGLETNSDNNQNPNGSFFESIHHLFCNSTRVPTTILMARDRNRFLLRTFWMKQIEFELNEGEDLNWTQIPIYY